MNEVLAIFEALPTEGTLSGEQVSALLEQRGWEAVRRVPSLPFPPVWRRETLRAGIVGEGPVSLEVTLWEHEVEELRGDEGLGPVYDAATRESERRAAEVTASPLAERLTPAGDEVTGGLDYIHHRAWRLSDRTLLVGAIQHDTDLPVYVVAAIG